MKIHYLTRPRRSFSAETELSSYSARRSFVRRNIVGLCILVTLLAASWWIIPGHFFNAASADTNAALRPLNVGGVPPLLRISRDQGQDQATRPLRMSVGLALRNQSQLN